MELLFWLSTILILHAYLGYPLVLMARARLWPKQARKAEITPLVSLIIPAYNEQRVIRDKMENCLELDYPKDKLEVIVASDGSTDRTNRIVQEYQDKGVKLLAFTQRRGKPSLYYRAMAQVSGEIIVFSDADAILAEDAITNIVQNFNDERIGCVEGVRIDADPQGVPLDSIYWKYETFIKLQAAGSFCSLGATGALFAIRRKLYQPIDEDRGDDFEIPIRVRLQGWGVVTDQEAMAYHPWLENDDEFRRIVRIVSFMLPSAAVLLSEAIQKRKIFLAFQLFSHKFLRWFVPVLLITLFFSSLFLSQQHFYRGILALQVAFYLMAITGYIMEKNRLEVKTILNIPYYFCLINFASLWGIVRFLRGEAAGKWSKTGRISSS